MISVRNLTKSFGRVKAVEDLSFDVASGEILGFLGPNGAGKTTTMRILTGYIGADSGSVTIDGREIAEDREAAKAKIGYLPENNPLYEDMSVVDYLAFAGRVRGLSGDALDARIHDQMRLYGLEKVAGRDIGELSKGYRQRVGLAQAALHDPSILILDEPTSGLDPNQIVEIRNLIRETGKTKTVILSTHNLGEVEATCSRIIIINQGRLVADEKTEELNLKGPSATVNIVLKGEGDLIAALKAVPGVASASLTGGEGAFREFAIGCAAGADPREALFDLAVQNGWKIVEMRKESPKLEEVFAQMTRQ